MAAMASRLATFRRILFWAPLCCWLTVLLPPPVSPLRPWLQVLTGPWGHGKGDTLIVLAAEEVAGPMLGLHTYWRMVNAVYQWRQGHYQRMVLSGHNSSLLMRDFAIQQGVPSDAIQVENEEKTTREQALRLAALLGQSTGRRLVLLTSDFHCRRASAALRRAGLIIDALPAPDAGKRLNSWTSRFEVAADLALETIKWAEYGRRGWL